MIVCPRFLSSTPSQSFTSGNACDTQRLCRSSAAALLAVRSTVDCHSEQSEQGRNGIRQPQWRPILSKSPAAQGVRMKGRCSFNPGASSIRSSYGYMGERRLYNLNSHFFFQISHTSRYHHSPYHLPTFSATLSILST
jgi:hypothetical protein